MLTMSTFISLENSHPYDRILAMKRTNHRIRISLFLIFLGVLVCIVSSYTTTGNASLKEDLQTTQNIITVPAIPVVIKSRYEVDWSFVGRVEASLRSLVGYEIGESYFGY